MFQTLPRRGFVRLPPAVMVERSGGAIQPFAPAIELPGRGLEPLRISPPDPKSGASANFATLAPIKQDRAQLTLGQHSRNGPE